MKYSGNTSNIRDHLRRKYPGQLELNNFNRQTESPKIEDEPIQDQPNSEPSTSGQSQFQDRQLPSKSTPSHSFRKRHRQMKLFVKNKKTELSEAEKDAIDVSLIKMIALDYQPLALVENPGFLEYSKKLQPLYKPPNKKLLSLKMLPNVYNKIYEKVNIILARVDNIAVTTDIWTSDSNKAFLTVTSHFIYNDLIHNAVLATKEIPEAHTGINIASALSEIFNIWQIQNKIITIVSDNGPHIKNAITEQLKRIHYPCVAHTLNLYVTDAINSNQNCN